MQVLNNTLSPALTQVAVKAAAGKPVGLGEVGTGASQETWSPPAKQRTN